MYNYNIKLLCKKKYLIRESYKIMRTFLIFGSRFVITEKVCDMNDINPACLHLLLFSCDGLPNPVNCDKFNGNVCLFVCWYDSPQWAMASSFTTFLDHPQRRIKIGRTPLDE